MPIFFKEKEKFNGFRAPSRELGHILSLRGKKTPLVATPLGRMALNLSYVETNMPWVSRHGGAGRTG